MNKTFKVIWNHSTQTWTAVSELAGTRKKSKSIKLAAISTALLMAATGVEAANVVSEAGELGQLSIATNKVTDQFYGNDRYKAETGLSQNVAGATVNAYDGIAIGNGAVSGSSSGTGGNGHVAIGLMAQASVGGANGQNAAVALGAYSLATGQGGTAIGAHSIADGLNSTALGKIAKANNDGATAVGTNTTAEWQGTALGNTAQALGFYATSIGVNSKANSRSSTSIGKEAVVSGENAIGIGTQTKVNGAGTVAVGSGTNVSSANVSTLGSNITVPAGRDGAVVLGHGSDAGKDTDVIAVHSAKISDGSKLTYTGFAGDLGGTNNKGKNKPAAKDKQGNFVSIGSEDDERQIKHVAAGRITADSTDALNGSQLYQVAKTLGNAAEGLADTLGVDLNEDGTVTNKFSQPLTVAEGSNYAKPADAGDVKTALTNLNNYVNAGWNVTASGNDYKNNVSVGHTVNFVGTGNVDVDGSTTKDGVRTINISADSPIDYATTKAEVDGNEVDVVKANDGKWYLKDKVDEDNNPKEGAASIPSSEILKKGAKLTDSDTENNPYEKGNSYTYDDKGNITATGYDKTKPESKDEITAGKNGVQLNNVGWATQPDQAVNKDQLDQTVNKSGFYVQQNGKSTLDGKAGSDKVSDTEKVTPNDVVNFVNGNGTVIKAVTKRDEVTGVDTTTVSVDMDTKALPVVYTDADGNKVVKHTDGKYYPEGTTFDAQGKPSNPEVTNVIASMNNGDNKTNKPMQLANIGSNLPTVNDTNKQAFDPNSTEPKDGKDNKSAPITAKEAADIAKKAGNNAATVSDVLNAGWNLQNNGEARDFVKPYDTVNFVNGKGTKAVVETADNLTSTVKFDVDAGEITADTTKPGAVKGPVTADEAKKLADDLKKAEQAVKDLPADATPEAKKAAQDALKAAQDAAAPLNKVATAQNVADMINASGFTLKTSNVDGGEKVSGDDEVINPGKAVEMIAGKNLTVKQEANGKVTYALKDDVEFTSVKVGEDKDGKKPINFTTEKATDASNNDPAKQPTTALNVSSSDGKPTQITGVGSTLNVKPVDTNPNGTPTADADKPNLVDLVGTKDAPVNKNAAATVGDLQNMGWVVSSDKTTDATGEYKDVVKNANEVRFVGKNAAKVSGKTVNGVRTITVDVEAPSVETAKITQNTNGSVAGPVAADEAKELADNLKKAEQAVKDLPADATPEAKKAAQDALKAAQDAAAPLNKVATAQNVAEAINNSGWRTNSTTATGGAKDTLINPGKAVNFEAGKNMEVAQTVDKDGNVAYTYATKDDVQFNSVQLGGNTGPKLTNDGNDLKVSGSNGTDPVKITNVADGNISADSKDAVNGSQLHATTQNINQSINRLGDTVNNIGGNVTRLSDKVDNMDRDYRAGIAGSNAAASLPQVYLPGKSMVAAAAGTFKGQNALAVGYSSISDNGKLIWKAQANLNSRADVGVGVGMGYLW